MKSIPFAILLLSSLQSLACDQLVGVWSCMSHQNDEEVSYKLEYKLQNGILIATVASEGEPDEVTRFDGSISIKPVDLAAGDLHLDGKFKHTAACTSNPIITTTKIEIPSPAILGLFTEETVDIEIELKRQHILNGNSLTIQGEVNNYVIKNGVKTRSEEGSSTNTDNCTKI